MDVDSPITARLIFWPVDRDAVWLKAEFTPEILAKICHVYGCPIKAFLIGRDSCPVKGACEGVTCENVTAKDWIRFLSVGAPIGGSNEK